MSNLVTLSKSPLMKKQRTSIIKSGNLSIGTKNIGSNFINKNVETTTNNLLDTYKKIVTIDNILKNLLKLKINQSKKERVTSERKDFEKKEKKLEKKTQPKEKTKSNLPSAPKMGFLDWIENFLLNTFLGFISIRLIDFLPHLTKILPTIIRAGEFIIDWGGKLLDGLVTFVDWGYKAYDGTRGFLKNLGGDGLVGVFDKFSGAIEGLIDVLIFASVVAMGMDRDGGGAGGKGGRRGFDSTGKRVGKGAQRRYAQRFGKDQFIDRFGRKNLRNLQGGAQRGMFQKGARSAFMGLAGKSGAKAILKFVKPLVSRIPIIGGLIEFGLSWALGEPVGKAAFRGIGAVLVGAIGTAIGGPIGAFLGSWAGGEAGGLLYDMFFNNKNPQNKVVKAAGGGKPATRGGKLVGGPAKRTIKKKKASRTIITPPTKLKAGSAVGGEKKIKELYPESKDKSKMSPFDFIKKSYERFSKSKGIERIASLAIKPLMGDSLNYADYKGAASVLNNWINQSMTPATLAYAGGGEVRMEQVIAGEDYSNILAKSLQTSIAPEADKIIQDLMKQLMLKQPTKEPDKTDLTVPTEEELPSEGLTEGKWGPLLDLIASKESGGNYEAMYPSTTLPGATKMTIAEVARRATGAVGKYQQLPEYLVSRARAAGLNPEKDLYSPENQDLIATKVNIEQNRGGRLWLDGKISDEQFMQRLSMEFAALPNARGEFYYPGQRSSIKPEQVKSALSKVKRGGYSKGSSPSAMVTGGRLPSSVTLTSGFGWRWGRQHKGVDLSAGEGSPISSAQDATVIHAGDLGDNYGKTVILRYSNGAETRFAHLDSFSVKRGQKIKAGDLIGTEGSTGRSTGPHLHFEYYPGGGALRYSGYADPTGVINSYFRYGGNVKPRVLKNPMGETSKFHGGIGFVSKDGLTLKLHKGEMFKVVDKDSVDLFGRDFIQDIIDIETKSQLIAKSPSIIEKLKAISNYTEDDLPVEIVYIEVPVPELVPVPSVSRPMIVAKTAVIDNNNMDILEIVG